MCQLFINANSDMWTSSTRSIRVGGVVTSIKLENFFWNILEEIAVKDDLTVAQLTTTLYYESMDAEHDISNFTSFLRVCVSRYLGLAADGYLDRNYHSPIRGLDAAKILVLEESKNKQRQQTILSRRTNYNITN